MKKLFTLFQKKKKFLFVAILLFLIISASTSWAQTAIFNPSMSITPYGSVDSNGSEGYANSIDNNVNTKFLDNYPDDGIGFTVDLGGVSKIASSISVTTANDTPGRDPKNYEVLGSNDGSNFTSIATGTIQCISTRFSTRFYCFENSTAYKYYRVNFTNTCSEYVFQFAEVQLYTPGPGIGGSVSANQSISGLISTTPSGEANLNSGSFVQIMAGYYTFQPKFSFTPGQTAAQSFKTSSNVILSAIKINIAEVITAGSYTLTIFQGEGTSGTELMNQVVSITNSGTNTFALDATLALIGEQSYTFKLETRDGNAKFNWTNSSGADYSRGSGYTNENNNNSDFNFQLVYQNNVNWQSVTLTGFFGGIQKWQKATDSIFSTPIDIPSIAATLEPYLVGDILQTTYFRAVVGCSSVYSDYVTIAVNSTNYTVTFDANGGSGSMATQTIASGVSASLRTNAFTRSGYTFAGWATTSGGAVAYTNSVSYTMGAADVTLYAKWNLNGSTTQIRNLQCGKTMNYITDAIQASPLVGATEYTFEVTRVDNNAVYTIVSPRYYFFPAAFIPNGLVWGNSYSIKVKAKIGGFYTAYGNTCIVTAPAEPAQSTLTKIRSLQCGKTMNYITDAIQASPVYLATQYEFNVTNGVTTIVIPSKNYYFRLSQFPGGGVLNTAYTITVRSKGTATAFTAYGAACVVRTPTARMSDVSTNDIFEVKAFPNPFASHFSVDIESSSDAPVEMKVYDMLGRTLEVRMATASELSVLKVGHNYPSGVYNILVRQGENVKSLRMMKR